MDIELQIRKHLPRDTQQTVCLIDEYLGSIGIKREVVTVNAYGIYKMTDLEDQRHKLKKILGNLYRLRT